MTKSKRSGPEEALLPASDSSVAAGFDGRANAVSKTGTAAIAFRAARRVVDDELTSMHSFDYHHMLAIRGRRPPA
jgi:hypothetical protein